MSDRLARIVRVVGIGLIFFHVATILQDVTVAYSPGPTTGQPPPSGPYYHYLVPVRVPAPVSTTSPVSVISQNQARVAVDAANVRSSPSIAASVLEQVKYGTELEITGQSADWFKVKLPDQSEGWVAPGWIVAGDQ